MTSCHADRLAGRCDLVGAGPGDPELLPLRAWRLIQSVTVLLVDDLVSADIVQFVSARLGLTQASLDSAPEDILGRPGNFQCPLQ